MSDSEVTSNPKLPFLDIITCPVTKEKLKLINNKLISESSKNIYHITENGIPLFAKEFITEDAKKQQTHYDKIWKQYTIILSYPHTEEYMKYLDKALLVATNNADMSIIAEICCGHGEALIAFKDKYKLGIGIDISVKMLNIAKKSTDNTKTTLIQGDATLLPLSDNSVTSVFMLGGIHHVNDRVRLFEEINRILKPGGRFYWREPLNDFFLWRWIRNVIYKISPTLDDSTESPLRFHQTRAALNKAGMKLEKWETYGFIGFCFFMNSDVLIFNRLFKYIPGIRYITRFFIYIDDMMRKIPFMKNYGLQVIGVAEKSTN